MQDLRARHGNWLVHIEVRERDAFLGALTHNMLAVSHRWEKPSEPDPEGVQFAAIKTHLAGHPEIEYVWFGLRGAARTLPPWQPAHLRRLFERASPSALPIDRPDGQPFGDVPYSLQISGVCPKSSQAGNDPRPSRSSSSTCYETSIYCTLARMCSSFSTFHVESLHSNSASYHVFSRLLLHLP